MKEKERMEEKITKRGKRDIWTEDSKTGEKRRGRHSSIPEMNQKLGCSTDRRVLPHSGNEPLDSALSLYGIRLWSVSMRH